MHKWVDILNRTINYLNSIDPEDRLVSTGGIESCLIALMRSGNGWEHWIKSQMIRERYSHDELKKIFEGIRKITVDFLELDRDWIETQIAKNTVFIAENKLVEDKNIVSDIEDNVYDTESYIR